MRQNGQGNPNHPPKGSVIRVEPIKTKREITRIRDLLRDKPRDLAIFNIGVNSNLRASDLSNLKVGQVKNLVPGDQLILREQKTGKIRAITVNGICFESIQILLRSKAMLNASDDSYLFQSKKGKGKLRANTLTNLVKLWTKNAGIKGNYGSHSLRKTFGYIHRTILGTDVPTLMHMFNHSTQRQTLDYLCIQPEEIRDAYLKEI